MSPHRKAAIDDVALMLEVVGAIFERFVDVIGHEIYWKEQEDAAVFEVALSWLEQYGAGFGEYNRLSVFEIEVASFYGLVYQNIVGDDQAVKLGNFCS